jgi:hypothetical protein
LAAAIDWLKGEPQLGQPRMQATVKGKRMGKRTRKLQLRGRKNARDSITVHLITVAINSIERKENHNSLILIPNDACE